MNSIKKKKKKAQLFLEQNGKCFFCNCHMILTFENKLGRPPEPNEATIDHLVDRFSACRQIPCLGAKRLVMACFKCNHERGVEAQRAQPIEVLRERSSRPPRKETMA